LSPFLRRKYNGSLTPHPVARNVVLKSIVPLNGTMIFSILILYATSIGAVKSDLWKETTLIEKVNEKSKTIQGWKCNHCETDFWNTNLARLQFTWAEWRQFTSRLYSRLLWG
jgi:transposase-like protein